MFVVSIVLLQSIFYNLVQFDGVRPRLWIAASKGPNPHECGEPRWNDTDKGKQNKSERKPDPMSLCPPQIPRGLTWAKTRASAVRVRRLYRLSYGMAFSRTFKQNISQVKIYQATYGKHDFWMCLTSKPQKTLMQMLCIWQQWRISRSDNKQPHLYLGKPRHMSLHMKLGPLLFNPQHFGIPRIYHQTPYERQNVKGGIITTLPDLHAVSASNTVLEAHNTYIPLASHNRDKDGRVN
jgi:hypothetical protein